MFSVEFVSFVKPGVTNIECTHSLKFGIVSDPTSEYDWKFKCY